MSKFISASYDLESRLSSLSLVNANTSATLFASSRGYDGVGNVTSVNTTVAAGTDNQAFCYDEQNRLTWAGSTGTPSCGSSLSSGSLSAAQYTQTFGYDSLDRLTSGPLGSYTYGDSHHLHAATAIGSSSYTASYDASGNMTCRAPSGSQTCSGTPTGQLLTYDNEGRTIAWQNDQSSPTSTEQMAYDGEGNRVALVANGGTPTYYLGSLEEVTGSTLTKYFPSAGGLPVALRVGTGGAVSYLVSDGLGSVSESLDSNGNVTFQQLFTPYGSVRYSSGTSPTSKAFTGQRNDSASGLDYYNARYYDPVAEHFSSADTMLDGLNRYAYVGGNPETLTDPSGHCFILCLAAPPVALGFWDVVGGIVATVLAPEFIIPVLIVAVVVVAVVAVGAWIWSSHHSADHTVTHTAVHAGTHATTVTISAGLGKVISTHHAKKGGNFRGKDQRQGEGEGNVKKTRAVKRS